MQLETIACNNCGAPLQIPASVQFVTCNHCGSQLAVRRGDSASYTEKLDKIDVRTEKMAQELAQLRYDSELAKLDREWEEERKQYLIKGKDGQTSEPDATSSIVGGVIAAVAGVAWMAFASSMPGSGAFPLFGLVFIAVGIGGAIYSLTKANEMTQARQRYLLRRSRLSVNNFLPDATTDTQVNPSSNPSTGIDAFLDRATKQANEAD